MSRQEALGLYIGNVANALSEAGENRAMDKRDLQVVEAGFAAALRTDHVAVQVRVGRQMPAMVQA